MHEQDGIVAHDRTRAGARRRGGNPDDAQGDDNRGTQEATSHGPHVRSETAGGGIGAALD